VAVSLLGDRPIRWGVLGTGAIAAAFTTDLGALADAQVVAVASRTQGGADEFARRFDIPRAYAGYSALGDDEEVDVVYVATPHVGHHDAALAAIRSGKAVLVEKPFSLNATEAREMVAAARDEGTFLMEAMWTRFLPHVVQIRELIAAGRLGEMRSLTAELGGVAPPDPSHRLNSPELGGGALLDIGVYLVSFASMLFGPPTAVLAAGYLGPTGVDAQTAIILSYPGGEQAALLTTIQTGNGNQAHLNGSLARVEIEGPFFMPAAFRVVGADGTIENFPNADPLRGLRHQAAEVHRCLRRGLIESPIMPLDESLQIMATLDTIRGQIGLRYPGEALPELPLSAAGRARP
jgi:predicted dehydrogenase